MNTVLEWIDQFNLEWNNIMSNLAPNLDIYELSRFLTQAQEQIVIQLYDGSFESKELIRRHLANLIESKSLSLTGDTPTTVFLKYLRYTKSLQSNLLVIISERAVLTNDCENEETVNVVPTTYDEVNTVMKNPFRRPSVNKVLRMDSATNTVHLYSSRPLIQYEYEYLRKPKPIILGNISTYGLTIDGQSNTLSPICELHEPLHRTIITQAVQLAAAAWASNNKQ